MPRARCCLLLVATLAAASFPELTRDGTIKQHTDAQARYNADRCFKKAGVSSFISSNRKYWIHPIRRPSTSYSWTPAGGTRIEVPTAAAARRALQNHTLVVIGDSLSIQSYVSLAALLVCGDEDAVRKGGGASIKLPEHSIELRHIDARFGLASTQTKATGGAWFVDHGKRKKMRDRGVKSQVFLWGKPGAPPRAVDGVAAALRDFKGREHVTYVVIYGHWFSSRRSDVSFYSKAGKAVAPGPKLYEQTTRVLSRELANGMTGTKQRAVFLGFPPIKNAKVGDVCSRDSKWSRAVRGRRLSRVTPSPRLTYARRYKLVSPASTQSGTASFSSTSSVRSRACHTRPTRTAARATAICQAGPTSRTRSFCGSLVA